MSLLFDARPLTVNPKLARLIGVNEAIVLQQVHYWLENNREARRNHKEGRYWTYNTQEQWLEQFPWLTLSTLKRTLKRLESLDLVISRKFNAGKWDHTKWYTINYESVDALKWKTAETPEKSDQVKMNQSNGSNWHDRTDQNEPFSYTETTTEITSEITEEETSVFDKTQRSHSLSQNDENVSIGDEDRSGQKSTPPSTRSNSTTGKNKIPREDQKCPAKSPRKKIMSYDDSGWLQLPGHSRYAVPTKLAIRRMQIVLSFDWLDCIWVDRDDRGRPYFVNDKGAEGYENEFYAADGRQSLLALRTFAYTQSGMSQEWFNEFLELLFRDSIKYCNKAGLSRAEDVIGQGLVFDEFIDAESLEVA